MIARLPQRISAALQHGSAHIAIRIMHPRREENGSAKYFELFKAMHAGVGDPVAEHLKRVYLPRWPSLSRCHEQVVIVLHPVRPAYQYPMTGVGIV